MNVVFIGGIYSIIKKYKSLNVTHLEELSPEWSRNMKKSRKKGEGGKSDNLGDEKNHKLEREGSREEENLERKNIGKREKYCLSCPLRAKFICSYCPTLKIFLFFKI